MKRTETQVLAVVIISVAMVIIGIFTSNTACASIMIPVVIGVAVIVLYKVVS